MRHLILTSLACLVLTAPAYAQEVGIKFRDMKVGTTLVTQSLSGKKRVTSETYIGRKGNLFVMEEHWLNPDGTKVNLGKVYYDQKGRETGSDRRRGEFIYTPYSCMFAVGDCKHTYDYPNSFTKKKIKRTKSTSSYKNRLEGDTFFVTWKLADGSTAEVPFKLGPYNFRVSAKYKNALGQLRGHKLIEIIEP